MMGFPIDHNNAGLGVILEAKLGDRIPCTDCISIFSGAMMEYQGDPRSTIDEKRRSGRGDKTISLWPRKGN